MGYTATPLFFDVFNIVSSPEVGGSREEIHICWEAHAGSTTRFIAFFLPDLNLLEGAKLLSLDSLPACACILAFRCTAPRGSR